MKKLLFLFVLGFFISFNSFSYDLAIKKIDIKELKKGYPDYHVIAENNQDAISVSLGNIFFRIDYFETEKENLEFEAASKHELENIGYYYMLTTQGEDIYMKGDGSVLTTIKGNRNFVVMSGGNQEEWKKARKIFFGLGKYMK